MTCSGALGGDGAGELAASVVGTLIALDSVLSEVDAFDLGLVAIVRKKME